MRIRNGNARSARVPVILLRKMRRDLWARKGALLALMIIMAVGVGAFTSMTSLYRDLKSSRDRYYTEKRLADFVVSLKRAPSWCVETLRGVPNLEVVQGRVNLAIRVDLPNLEEPLNGSAISMPVPRRPGLNDLLMRSGAWFSSDMAPEVILNESFARAHGLRPGHRLRVLMLDREHDLLITGTAMSPEFIYLIQDTGGFAPDASRFAVMYLPERFLQEAAGQQGAYNQIIGWVHDSSQGKLDATLKALARRLDAYGVFDTLRADEQPSVKFLADELRGLRVTSKLFPLIFLGVAVLVLNIMMERLVTQQRAVIGTLQAVGYTRGEITRHYMGYGVVIGTLGGVAGMGWGYYVQGFMIGLYRQFYALPSIDRHFHADLNAAGLLLSIVCAVAGTVHGVRVASRLQPAEAMSPPPPERGGRVFLERMPPVWNLLTFRGKMIARAILRNPFRTSVAILASAVAAALTVASLNMLSSLHYMTRHEFEATSHQDVTIATRDPEGAPALREIALLPGIAGTEGNLAVACELTNGAVTKRVAITGLPPDGRLVTPLDNSGRPIRIPPSGLVLSKRLAQRLGVRPGDLVRVRTLIARRTERTVAVAGVADTYLGLSAYADIEYLSRLIGEEHGANVIQASYIPDGRHGRFLEELRRRPSVMGMSERLRSLELVDKVFGENMGTMLGLMIFFSGMIAFGAVLNTALVSVSERQREIGTLRVLGYSPAQVWGIFSGESLTLNGLGVLLGLAGGIGLTHLLALAYNTDLYRFPVVIPARNLLIAAALMVGFAGLAQLVIYRLVLRLPWLEVLKVRE